MACFAAGAIIGASAGLFLAPTRGAQFRRKIVTFFAGEIDRVTSPAKPVRITAKPGHAHP
jgi:gas vesicle protein